MTKLLQFKNVELGILGTTLNNFELVGQASRGRNKLLAKVIEKQKEFDKDSNDIRKPYFETLENGELKADANGQLTQLKDVDITKCQKEIDDLSNEVVGIEFTEYSSKIEALYKALENYGIALKTYEAEMYDKLLDELEKNYEKEGK